MKTTTKTKTRSITTTLFTYKDLIDKLGLPEAAQIIVTPPKDYEEGIIILEKGTVLEVEYIEDNEYSSVQPQLAIGPRSN